MEALERGFEGDQGQAWDVFKTQTMASIPEDVRDKRDILSMTDLLALTHSTPLERCYHNALLNQFDLKLALGDTQSSMEERAQRVTTLLEIAAPEAAPWHQTRRQQPVKA
jgi:hypothetical protein